MDLSEEWKSLWPISSVFSAPLLLSSGGDSPLGPLFFNPSPQTLALLFSSPSLSPPLPPPFPHLSLSRFLSTSPSHPFSLLPSTSSSLASSLGPQLPNPACAFCHNLLQLLRFPAANSVLVFFPTGDNSDQVGFMVLSVEENSSKLNIKRGDECRVFTAKEKLNSRILRLLVNPVANSGNCSVSGTRIIGYLLACTMYAVHWFRVTIRGSDCGRPLLDFVGSKLFKSSSVVHACWSPHLPEESLVLLDSGNLLLFDLDSCSKMPNSNRRFSGKRLRGSWKESTYLEEGRWLSCEFSWHPRILIVAHSSAVFLVDLRYEGCNVTCLLKIDALAMSTSAQDDRFVAFSKAASDDFYFVVASDHWLLLCDVRKPFMPLLQWAHDIANPSYITVFPLFELRSHSKDDRFNWASKSGNCIIMGSFWNCEFSLFCYGPPPGGTVASEISRFCKSFYAWELPSELSLSGRECHCGSCLLREEFSKDALPEWVDWRQKKEIVLGFGILGKDLHNKELSELDGFGGFTLIRLMSSGKLESQRYCASWELIKLLGEAHTESPLHCEDSLLYAIGDTDYKFPKRFKYLEFGSLYGFMKDNLANLLLTKIKKPCKSPCEKDILSADFHQCICEKLKACGFNRLKSSPAVSDVFKDIRLLTSIHEVALRRIWASLPTDLLQLAFSCYSEFLEVLVDHKKVSLEFLGVPSEPQLPPFVFRTPSCRSGKWSQKVQPGTAFVGPVLPTPVLITLRNMRMEEEADILSANAELSNQCNDVLQVASEMVIPCSSSDLHDDHAVSLSDDRDAWSYGNQKVNLFCLHKPSALSRKFSTMDPTLENSVCNNQNFTTFISKTPVKEHVSNIRMEMVEPELFNSVSPLELKFDDHTINFGPKEMKAFKLLRRQYSNFLQRLSVYQEYFESYNFQK
ncbi:Serine/threonine-protein kinase cdc7 [Actinidia chinensis var. chinensis]|uniref:Serine/threonine-protein kinase cdc7 n=1 Tax=Actinidia chinensis var. chinensis TaxID=1590841 RepID=A0A2R6QIB7_ACTCC|nr:Serine/threonine-protein kinase cdc7 [Actinidia chinensis var. chinensis]